MPRLKLIRVRCEIKTIQGKFVGQHPTLKKIKIVISSLFSIGRVNRNSS